MTADAETRLIRVNELLASGKTYQQIADELGFASRDAVAGFVHRARQTGAKPPTLVPAPKPPPPGARAPRRLTDLHRNECRWAVSQDESGRWLFCSEPTLPARPFCPRHTERAKA